MSDEFDALDYQLLLNDLRAALAVQDEATLRAVMSNNINVILGALALAVLEREREP